MFQAAIKAGDAKSWRLPFIGREIMIKKSKERENKERKRKKERKTDRQTDRQRGRNTQIKNKERDAQH